MLLLEKVFQIINNSGLDYCVQNKYEMMPEEIPSDIDMMYRNASEADLDRIVINIAKETGLIITQKIVQDFGEFTYIISYPAPISRFQLQLDFYKVISKGDIHNVLVANELLDNKRFIKNFYIPGKYDELRYIFVRRTLKKDLDIKDLKKINILYEDIYLEKLKFDFGDETAFLIIEIIKKEDISIFYDNYDIFYKSIMKMSKKKFKIKEKIKYVIFKLLNYPSKRILHKCGMSIVFLAPDGTGKSTIIKHISETCSGSFYGIEKMYFRPRFFKNLGSYNRINPSEEAKKNDNPHNIKVNGKIKSFLRFIFYNFDFLFGTFLIVNKYKMKKKLVIFDRYYYDYYADMKRYQYSISKRWVDIFRFMIPEPDIVFILDAPNLVIRNRKEELTIEEIEQQREDFKNASKKIKNSIIIDTNKDINRVIKEITEIILATQERKTQKILISK